MRPPRKFEDLVVGESRQSALRDVGADEILEFARRWDPQWFHADPDAARDSVFGELVASGVHVLAIWRQLDHQMNGDIDFVCGVGFDELRLKRALRAGDRVFARSEIVELRPSASRNDRGTAITAYALLTEAGHEIVTFRSINLVHRRAPAA
ncbi:MAG: MaoC/PaaZ C-terminal domain-containing protein [Thermaurantiacus sp.]